jgi:predicted lactoylglutathione lyase
MRPWLSVVNLGVADVERSRRFYVDGMGMTPRPEGNERVFWIAMDKTWVGFFERDRLAVLAGIDPTGSGFGGVTLSHNVQSKEEVDAVLNQAAAAGGTITMPAEDHNEGKSRGGYFADPDGYCWEVVYSPRWTDLTWPDGVPEGVTSQ